MQLDSVCEFIGAVSIMIMWSLGKDTSFLPFIFEWFSVVYESYMDLNKIKKNGSFMCIINCPEKGEQYFRLTLEVD